MSSIAGQSGYRWMPATAFALLALWGIVSVCRRSARIKRLKDALKRRPAPHARAASTPAKDELTLRESAFEASAAGRLIPIAVGGFVLAFLILLVATWRRSSTAAPDHGIPVGGRVCGRLRPDVGGVMVIEQIPRRDFASFEKYTEYNRTLRTGRLPAGIDPEVWRRRLEMQSTREPDEAVAGVGFLVAVGIPSIVTDQSVYHWVTASLFQLVAM